MGGLSSHTWQGHAMCVVAPLGEDFPNLLDHSDHLLKDLAGNAMSVPVCQAVFFAVSRAFMGCVALKTAAPN